jgi:hypothetical protein
MAGEGTAAGAATGTAISPGMGTAIGAGIGAAGEIIGSLLGSDGPEGMDPATQYILQRMGIDVSSFMAEYNLINQQYQQQMESYGYGAYNDIYGGAQKASGEYAKSAFEGDLSPGAENMITQYGQDLGNQQNLSKEDIINQAIQSGRSVDSPDVQAQLAKSSTGVRSAFQGGKSKIMAADYQNNIKNSLSAMEVAKSGRIAGGEPPATPMDEGKAAFAAANEKYTTDKAAYDAKVANIKAQFSRVPFGSVIANQQIAKIPAPQKPVESAFGTSYGTVPRSAGPEGSKTIGNEIASGPGTEPTKMMIQPGQPGFKNDKSNVNPAWLDWERRKNQAAAGAVQGVA